MSPISSPQTRAPIPLPLLTSSVAIVGAGIAGLTLAIGLKRRGVNVEVFEKRTEAELRAEGAFLTLAPNGVNALRSVGLDSKVSGAGILTTGLDIRNERGKRVAFINYGRHSDRFGAPSVTIGRGTLLGLLLDRARDLAVNLRLSQSVAAFEQDTDRVVVTSGEIVASFDCLVGADGLRSRIRKLMMPEAPSPRYTNLIGTGGFVNAPDVPSTAGSMQMVFGRRAFFGYLKDGDGPVHWFNSYPADEAAVQPIDDPVAYARFIASLHAEDPSEVSRIVARIDRIERSYPIYDMPDLPSWSKGRVLILGDAAHAVAPHSGQGASMAIEDAVVLAAALPRAVDVPSALRDFEVFRRPRTCKAIEIGRMSGSQKQAQGWLALRIRDAMLPLVMPMAVKAQESMYSFRADLTPFALEPD
jgi:2-polyprenyl-6-methoxyphenol hydroxylase-like FAD-dependent oxidoreductase